MVVFLGMFLGIFLKSLRLELVCCAARCWNEHSTLLCCAVLLLYRMCCDVEIIERGHR
jgi:hypothetical protein